MSPRVIREFIYSRKRVSLLRELTVIIKILRKSWMKCSSLSLLTKLWYLYSILAEVSQRRSIRNYSSHRDQKMACMFAGKSSKTLMERSLLRAKLVWEQDSRSAWKSLSQQRKVIVWSKVLVTFLRMTKF